MIIAKVNFSARIEPKQFMAKSMFKNIILSKLDTV